MTPTDEFLGRRRVLEPRYRSMKYSNFRPVQLPLNIFFTKLFFFQFQNCILFHVLHILYLIFIFIGWSQTLFQRNSKSREISENHLGVTTLKTRRSKLQPKLQPQSPKLQPQSPGSLIRISFSGVKIFEIRPRKFFKSNFFQGQNGE